MLVFRNLPFYRMAKKQKKTQTRERKTDEWKIKIALKSETKQTQDTNTRSNRHPLIQEGDFLIEESKTTVTHRFKK